MGMARHELVRFQNGTVSVRPVSAREAMHSSIGPWEEANAVYIAQSRLSERLRNGAGPLVLYDVGLGIGANALAAIACHASAAPNRALHIVSFENDLSGIRFALEQAEQFAFLSDREGTVRELLDLRSTSPGPGILWELKVGDFREEVLSAPAAPEVIFYDFYSPAQTPNVWTVDCLKRLRSVCRENATDRGTVLLTYVASTAARSAMLLAGFYVGYGSKTSAKLETTIASTRFQDLERPLDKKWLGKLRRSSKPLPLGPSASLSQAFNPLMTTLGPSASLSQAHFESLERIAKLEQFARA